MVKVQTLSRTGLHTALYPVQGREAKNYTLSSGTSPYRPYKGVPPPVSLSSTYRDMTKTKVSVKRHLPAPSQMFFVLCRQARGQASTCGSSKQNEPFHQKSANCQENHNPVN